MGYTTTYTRPVDIKKLDFIHEALQQAGVRSALELGCGRGPIATSLAASSYDVLGVELYEVEAEAARARGVEVVVADACSYDAGRKFDAVIASEVFSNVDDPAALARNARRHLESGGVLIVTSLNGYGPYELRGKHLSLRYRLRRLKTLRRLTGRDAYVSGGLTRAQFFTLGRLCSTIEGAGFRCVRRQNSDFLTGRDVRFADRLPHWLASGWYLAFEAV